MNKELQSETVSTSSATFMVTVNKLPDHNKSSKIKARQNMRNSTVSPDESKLYCPYSG